MKWSAAIILFLVLLPVVTVEAQDSDQGEEEYKSRCSVCHGVDAKGNGPWAAQLKTAPADLTGLAKNNGGIFPRDRISEKIDGRQEVAAHGSRDMPAFGAAWIYSSPASKTRLELLLDYLSRIQVSTVAPAQPSPPSQAHRSTPGKVLPARLGFARHGSSAD
jgi:hypothetical protein